MQEGARHDRASDVRANTWQAGQACDEVERRHRRPLLVKFPATAASGQGARGAGRAMRTSGSDARFGVAGTEVAVRQGREPVAGQ